LTDNKQVYDFGRHSSTELHECNRKLRSLSTLVARTINCKTHKVD